MSDRAAPERSSETASASEASARSVREGAIPGPSGALALSGAPAAAGIAAPGLLALQRGAGNRAVTGALARSGRVLHRQPVATAPTPKTAKRWMKIIFTPSEPMSAREFLIRTHMQFHGVDRDRATKMVDHAPPGAFTGPHNTGGVSAAEVGKPLLVHFEVSGSGGTGGDAPAPGEDGATIQAAREAYEDLGAADKRAVTAETNRRYWRWTQQKAGTQIGMSKDEAALRRYWMEIRDEVMRERERLDDLDPRVAEFMRPGGREIRPEEYQAALRVAGKLEGFTDEDWALYKRRVNSSTTDWGVLEDSIDRFKARQERERKIRDQVKGQEALYKRVRSFRELERLSFSHDSAGLDRIVAEERQEVMKEVQSHGYKTIGEFEAACDAYLRHFRDRAVEIALLALAASERVVTAELRRYEEAGNVKALLDRLEPLRTRWSEMVDANMRGTRKIKQVTPGGAIYEPDTPEKVAARKEGEEKRKQVEAERAEVAKSSPVLKDPELGTWQLAHATTTEKLGELVREDARDRLADIARTRSKLMEDPDVVFRFDRVVTLALQELGAGAGSIGALIVAGHQEDVARSQMIIGFMVAALAIGLGLLTMGGGTVAVLAAAGGFTISAIQVDEEWQKYQDAQAAAHSAFDTGQSLSSEDPSFAWVALALLGAGLDAAALAGALKAAGPAAKLLNETGDVVKFEAKLAEAQGLSQALKDRLAKFGKAELEYRAAGEELGKALKASMGKMYSGGIDPEVIVAATKAAYSAAKKGIRKFEVWLADLKLQKLLKGVDLEKLTPEQLAQLRQAFEAGVDQEAKGILKGAGTTATEAAPKAPVVKTRDARVVADARTAGTGGIRSITYNLTPTNQVEVVIQGRLRAPIAERAANAPNYNTEKIWGQLRKEHKVPDWEAAHLWGPGFGDEAAAGIMLAPKEVNQVWQNRGVEQFLREMRAEAGKLGGEVELKAVATSQVRTLEGGAGDSFLSHVQYEFSIVAPGKAPKKFGYVEFSVGKPPGGKVSEPFVNKAAAGATR